MGNTPSVFDFEEQEIQDFIKCEILDFIDVTDDYFSDDDNIKTKRQRVKKKTIEDWWQTEWGQMLQNPNLKDVTTNEGREFRRRFRIPGMFTSVLSSKFIPLNKITYYTIGRFFLEWLVPECERVNIFECQRTKEGKLLGYIPTEIKCLIALRLLARGNVVDDISEFSSAGGTTVRSIFKKIVINFHKAFNKDFIRMPEGDELEKVLSVYGRLGFPGAVGSMDCTHIRWAACPAELTRACTGKELCPTLSFQVMVDHARRINHVSNSFFGTSNDINVCQYDFIVRNDK